MKRATDKQTISLVMTGASGAAYGLRLLQCLLDSGRRVYLMVSEAARMVLEMETGLKLPTAASETERVLRERYAITDGRLRVFGKQQWLAPVASGSGAADAMVVCPCTTGSLAAIALGSSDNLIERAADVMLKEQRKLILVVRETPLSALHLENMLKLARLGVVILPASPGFYQEPKAVGDLVDFIVARILDQLAVEHQLLPRWGADT